MTLKKTLNFSNLKSFFYFLFYTSSLGINDLLVYEVSIQIQLSKMGSCIDMCFEKYFEIFFEVLFESFHKINSIPNVFIAKYAIEIYNPLKVI